MLAQQDIDPPVAAAGCTREQFPLQVDALLNRHSVEQERFESGGIRPKVWHRTIWRHGSA
jgi:hypothetical protein